MLSIIFKAILIYTLYRLAKGIFNAYRLSKKIRDSWTRSAKPSPQNHQQQTFEAKFRRLNDDD